MLNDLRYAVRMLLKSPSFTAVAVLTLALGIGANSSIFSLVDAILLKRLPIKNPQELVRIGVTRNSKRGEPRVIPYPMYDELRRSTEVFGGVLTHGDDGMSFREVGKAEVTERVMGEWVSGNYFSLLGVNAFLGRVFSEEDDKTPGGHPVAILSYGFWKRRLGGDSTVVGSTIYLNGDPYTVVGVTPPAFFGLEVGFSPDVRVPMGEGASVQTWARLKPGVSIQQAEAATEVVYQQVLQENPELKSDRRYGTQHIELLPGVRGFSSLRRQFEEPLFILVTIVGMVLLVACINISNLLLARAAARQKEVAVRLAVGASRLRLVRQLLTEGVLLSLFGGFAGLLVAYWGTDLLFSFLPQDNKPIILELHPDIRMVVFNFCIAMITGVLFALAPAIRGTRSGLGPLLKGDTHVDRHKPLRFELRKALVVFQVALSLTLLVVATLFVRTLANLEAVDSASNTDKILIFSMKHVRERYTSDQIARFYEELIQRVEVLPGVRSASLAAGIRRGILSPGGTVSVHGVEGQFNSDTSAHLDEVSPMFFRTMGAPFLMGRDFSFADKSGSSKVAIINQRFAHYFFGNQNPIGQRIGISELAAQDLEIVGVVGDTRYVNLREPPRRVVYLPLLQYPARHDIYALHVLAAAAPNQLISTIRKEFQSLDKDLPVFNIKTFAKLVDESLAQERLLATLSSFFSLLTLLLASIGLYGVMAYGVSRRTRELGIRMALGAQRHEVLWLVLKETLGLVAIGVAAGLAVTFITTRLIKSHLFGIAPTDLTTVVLATAVLGAVAVSAGYLPARRATQIDPMVALRYE